jgi:hypothetical protein
VSLQDDFGTNWESQYHLSDFDQIPAATVIATNLVASDFHTLWTVFG